MVVETDLVCPDTLHSSDNSGFSDHKTGVSSGSLGSMLYHDLMVDNRVQGSPMNAHSASLKEWFPLVPGTGTYFTERNFSLPTSSTTSSLAQRDPNYNPDFGENFDVNTSQGETDIQFMNTVAEIHPQCMFLGIYVGLLEVAFLLCLWNYDLGHCHCML